MYDSRGSIGKTQYNMVAYKSMVSFSSSVAEYLPSTTWVTPKSITVVMAVMAWSSVRLKVRMAKSRVLL